MANTSVFTGADGSLALSTQQTPEGTAAQAAIDQFGVQVIGRVQDVTVQVNSDVKPFHEIGQRYATQLRPGNVEVRGTIGRADRLEFGAHYRFLRVLEHRIQFWRMRRTHLMPLADDDLRRLARSAGLEAWDTKRCGAMR